MLPPHGVSDELCQSELTLTLKKLKECTMVRIFTSVALLGISFTLAPKANAQFQVRTADPTAQSPANLQEVNDIDEGEALFDPINSATISGFTNFPIINFGPGNDGDFGSDAAFPNGVANTEDFALEALGVFTFNTTGSYTFRVNSDDGFRLRFGVDGNGDGGTVYSEFVGPRGPANTDGGPQVQTAGSSQVAGLTFFERGGGDEVELSYSVNGGAFALVGSTSDITVTPVPEPGSVMLLSLGLVAFAARRRRSS